MTQIRDSSLSRRRVLQGAAWATPAILIATAAPALAASLPPSPLVLVAPRAVGFKSLTYSMTLGTNMVLEPGFYIVATSTHRITGSSASDGWSPNTSHTIFTHMGLATLTTWPFTVSFKYGSNDTVHIFTTFTLFDWTGVQRAILGPV